MNGRMVLAEDKCVGCRLCELACAMQPKNRRDLEDGVIDPSRSRINVDRDLVGAVAKVYVCVQCGQRLCIDVCLHKALSVNRVTGALAVDDSKCDGCEKCVITCPVGAIRLVSPKGPVRVCDLCDGDPACVKICPSRSILYTDLTAVRDETLKRIGATSLKAHKAFTRAIVEEPDRKTERG